MKNIYCLILVSFSLIAFHTQNAFTQSPYETNWTKDSLIFGSGLAVAFVGSSLDDAITPLTIQEINDLSRDDVNWFDRSATYNYSETVADASDVFLVATCLLSPFTLLTFDDIRSDFGTVSTMYLETLLFSTFVPSLGKGGVERVRPFVYNADAPLDEKTKKEAKRSFFSGHTTCAFSSAVFFSTVYSDYFPNSEWKPYVWGGSLFVASMVGYLRYEAGAHFPTDVLVGAAVGSAIGYFIPYFHKRCNFSSLLVIPTCSTKQIRLVLDYTF